MNPEDNDKNSIIDIFLKQAHQHKEKKAFTFLIDGEDQEVSLSYNNLLERSKSIAVHLKAIIKKGDRALLAFPSSLEYIAAFYGCILAGIIAVPAFPPDPARLKRSTSRLKAITENAEPSVILTSSLIKTIMDNDNSLNEFFQSIPVIATDKIDITLADQWSMPVINNNDTAFLQYSSGSTGTPRGVMVTHKNVIADLKMIMNSMNHNSDTVLMTWLPFFHDACLVGFILHTVFAGAHCVLMSPESFMQKPLRWLRALTKFKATATLGPNYAYEICTEKITVDEIKDLELSSLKVACNGSEPVYADTMRKFFEKFAACGFKKTTFQCNYGLAEATLLISGGTLEELIVSKQVSAVSLMYNKIEDPHDSNDLCEITGSGLIYNGQTVRIVDPETKKICSNGEIGEIWVQSDTVAAGYWNRPEDTKKTFSAYISENHEGPYLRTGDFGFIDINELFITGRIKDLLIIRGQNHYPQDIERSASRSHVDLRNGCCIAFSIVKNQQEELVIVQELIKSAVKSFNGEEIRKAIINTVNENHGIVPGAIALIQTGNIPKTTSGKLQRHAAAKSYFDGSLDILYSWTNKSSKGMKLIKLDEGKISAAEMEKWLLESIAKISLIKENEILPDDTFSSLGLDSSKIVELTGYLEKFLLIPIAPTLAYNYPTIKKLAAHLSGKTISQDAAAHIETKYHKNSYISKKNNDYAVIGIGCRFPGAYDVNAYWKLLINGVDAISIVPESRFSIENYYHPDHEHPGTINSKYGGFIDDIELFDPGFFGISPMEAHRMDPSQRLLLEMTLHALNDAGISKESINGSDTGVFIGNSQTEYAQFQFAIPELVNIHTMTGSALGISANRISYIFNLKGPSITIDTICSSSLLSLHYACMSMDRGDCSMALVGGVNLILTPYSSIGLSKLGLLAPDGRCKSFDASANGIARSEGAAVMLISPLESAKKNGHDIYAVIKGSAVVQDGHSNGITAPNGIAQELMLRKAYDAAGISPSKVQYIETHGTGTILGDPIEAGAIGSVLSRNRNKNNPCYIGSVKNNIGHAESVGGIASFIKTILALKNRTLPAHIHYSKPNPLIAFDEMNLAINDKTIEWPSDEHAIAGVTSLAFGGTNVHVVVEEFIDKKYISVQKKAAIRPGEKKSFWIQYNDKPITWDVLRKINRGGTGRISSPAGEPIYQSLDPDVKISELEVSSDLFPGILDHVVHNTTVLSTAFLLEIVMQSALQLFVNEIPGIKDFVLSMGVHIPKNSSRILQIVFYPLKNNECHVKINSRKIDESKWTSHADLSLFLGEKLNIGYEKKENIFARCTEKLPVQNHYDDFLRRGMNWGAGFRWLNDIVMGHKESAAVISEPVGYKSDSNYYIEPGLLDSALQIIGAALIRENNHAYLLTGIEKYILLQKSGHARWAHAEITEIDNTSLNTIKGNVALMDGSDNIIALINGVKLTRLGIDENKNDADKKITFSDKTADISFEKLLKADDQDKKIILKSYILTLMEELFDYSPQNFDLNAGINSIGLDSLMALEIRNAIELDLSIVIRMDEILEDFSAIDLINIIIKKFSDLKIENKPLIKNNNNFTLINDSKEGRLYDCRDGIFCMEFTSLHHTITEQTIYFLKNSLNYIEENGKACIIGSPSAGVSSAFSVGIDFNSLLQLINQQNFGKISEFIDEFQDIIRKISYSPFPVVAAPFGFTLGGGLEICLAADLVVAGIDIMAGLVERNAGIIPGGGGCVNMWKKICEEDGLLKKINCSGENLAAAFRKVFGIISIGSISTGIEDAVSRRYLPASSVRVEKRNDLFQTALDETRKILSTGYTPPVPLQVPILGKASKSIIREEIELMKRINAFTEYDVYILQQLGKVLSGGQFELGTFIDESVMYTLEKEHIILLLKNNETVKRISALAKIRDSV